MGWHPRYICHCGYDHRERRNMNKEKMLKVVYHLDEDGRKKDIINGGNGKREQVFYVPVTERLLEMAKCDFEGNLKLEVKIPVYRYNYRWKDENDGDFSYKEYYVSNISCSITEFSSPQTIDSILKAYDEAEKTRIEMEKELEKMNKEAYNERLKEYQELLERRKEKERKLKEEKEKEIARLEALRKEQEDWIRKHGSQYLKDCLELGVKANLEYIVERAAMEHPSYVVDYADEADFEDRISPSQEALDELKRLRQQGIDSKIVWLTKPPMERKPENIDDYYYMIAEYKPREAVMIRGYLGKYYLFKEF